MDEQGTINTICPTCDGSGGIRVARAIVHLQGNRPTGPAATAWVLEECRTCEGDGKLPGLQAPV
ncbi:DnaJ-class molecular chaperone [Kribbella aluminosa]|uniref:DnaJ-class molecular chaperone n=1 Tax=Kribbella aluminosa TaxID=416017 RepID=A0ABS4UMB4_9ACTN|nr:DnaJ-class molecular chaperone [Kribbella aluminosa]